MEIDKLFPEEIRKFLHSLLHRWKKEKNLYNFDPSPHDSNQVK